MHSIVPNQKADAIFQQTFKGMWQYVLDHARIDYNGQITINFCVENKDDFYRKLKSRVFTKYAKRDVSALYGKAEEIRRYYNANKVVHRFYRKAFWKIWYLNVLRRVNRYCRERIVLEDYPYMADK